MKKMRKTITVTKFEKIFEIFEIFLLLKNVKKKLFHETSSNSRKSMVNLLFWIGKFFQRSQNMKDFPLVTVMVLRIFFMTNKKFYFVQISKKKMPFGETLFFQDGHLINTQCAEKNCSKDLLFLEIWIFPILLVYYGPPLWKNCNFFFS